MAFSAARIPDKLKEAYKQKRCAVLVGAGASAGAGLPTWGAFLSKMVAEGQRHLLIKGDRAAEYRKLIKDPAKFLMIASGLKEDIRTYFDEFIDSTFIAPKPKPTKLHNALVSLDNLQFVLTTNYDTIIERAYRLAGQDDVPVLSFSDVGELQRRLAKREFFILKAHGDAAKVGNGIILTELDYRDILYRQRAYQGLLSAMFTMFTVVFVGASMTDPEIRLLLNYIADAFAPNAGPSHYALMSEDEITQVEKDRWYKDLNMQLVPVSKAHNYAEITEFLEVLAAAP
jgi:SIR2-like domain